MLLSGDRASVYSASTVHNHDPDGLVRYNEIYNQIDPRRDQASSLREGECGLGQAFVSNEDIKHTAYFADISIAADVCDSVHGVIIDDELGRLTISVQRGFREDYFERANARRMKAVLPIIKRHIRSSKIAACLSNDLEIGDGLFGCLLAPDFQTQMINHSSTNAFVILNGQIAIANNQLRIENAKIKLAFIEGISVAQAGESASFQIGDTIFRISPVAKQLKWLPQRNDTVLLTIKKRKEPVSVLIFAKAFEFTEQEEKILISLTSGSSLRNCADQLSVTYETIRWHVKNMCAKSGSGGAGLMIDAARTGDLSRLTQDILPTETS